MSPEIGFRPLAEPDLPRLHGWLNSEHVAEWYGTDEGDDSSEQGIREKYLPYIDGDPRTAHYVILLDGRPAGMIQWYRVGDYPEYCQAVTVDPGSIAIDVFLGDPRQVHLGFGPRVIRRFLREIAFPDSGASLCHIGPAITNEAAKRAYAKVGFRFLKTVEVPGERYPEHLMQLLRSELAESDDDAGWVGGGRRAASERAECYWTREFGCPVGELFGKPQQILTHGGGLSGYRGIFALFREGRVTVSFPADLLDSLRGRLPGDQFSPETFVRAFALPGFESIGPAYVGYADEVGAPGHAGRVLSGDDRAAAAELRAACGEAEWDHGGSRVGEDHCVGVFSRGRLVSLAGYVRWPCGIAHLYVVTHPGYRGKGFGASAVALTATEALAAGLTPQFRTLEANAPAIRIAESLGFAHFASSVAVRVLGA